jgi:hypothetical protein
MTVPICVVCGAVSDVSGLCLPHKYDEQLIAEIRRGTFLPIDWKYISSLADRLEASITRAERAERIIVSLVRDNTTDPIDGTHDEILSYIYNLYGDARE